MRVRALRTFHHDDMVRRGNIIDVTKGDAQILISRGLAADAEVAETAKPAEPAKEPAKEPAGRRKKADDAKAEDQD